MIYAKVSILTSENYLGIYQVQMQLMCKIKINPDGIFVSRNRRKNASEKENR